ncbi:MAG TPA: beta-ketoacyl-ACP synthase III [Acidimicrobiia bacterium]|nr:beta-ketoacyl-ACP synthase III [Acidimicrobiia bacterium]
MLRPTITGWGRCTPDLVVTNDDLGTVMDTSDEWITSRSGIKERRVSHVNNSDLATVAARRALAAAGLQATDLDYILVATATPDRFIPAMACHVQANLGINNIGASDVNAGCTGFIYGLSLAHGLMATGAAQRILLIGSERLTPYLDLERRDTAVLFGDGAGAVILEAVEREDGLRSINVGANGSLAGALTVEGAGSSWREQPMPVRVVMDGREVFRNAVVGMEAAANKALSDAGWTIDDLDLLIPHQANIRIIDATTKRLGIDPDKVYTNIESYGNTSAASIPIALSEAVDRGRVPPGAKIVLVAFGAGLTWGAATIQWGDRSEPRGLSDAVLPTSDRSGIQIMADRQSAWHR